MGVLLRYVPTNEDEVYSILNILEDRLKHANCAVVLGAAKVCYTVCVRMDINVQSHT